MSFLIIRNKVVACTRDHYQDNADVLIAWGTSTSRSQARVSNTAKWRHCRRSKPAGREEGKLLFILPERRQHQGAMEQKQEKQTIESKNKIDKAKIKYREKETEYRSARDEAVATFNQERLKLDGITIKKDGIKDSSLAVELWSKVWRLASERDELRLGWHDEWRKQNWVKDYES